jgi:hypothetical protein
MRFADTLKIKVARLSNGRPRLFAPETTQVMLLRLSELVGSGVQTAIGPWRPSHGL